MPRPTRIEYNDAWFHVMNRAGARRQAFLSDKHRKCFLDNLAEGVELYGIEIHAYCLMGNHYHLLVRTPRLGLSQAMQRLNGIYTQRFNKMEKLDGPLFRGRFKSIVIEESTYLHEVHRYIHRNPVEAGLASNPADYVWSSCRAYLGQSEIPNWLTTQRILSELGPNPVDYFARHVAQKNSPLLEEFYNARRIPSVLGSEFYQHTVAQKSVVPEPRTQAAVLSESILRRVAGHFCVEPNSILVARAGVKNLPRTISMYLHRRHGAYTGELGEWFGVGATSVSRTLSRFDLLLKTEPDLAAIVGALEN